MVIGPAFKIFARKRRGPQSLYLKIHFIGQNPNQISDPQIMTFVFCGWAHGL